MSRKGAFCAAAAVSFMFLTAKRYLQGATSDAIGDFVVLYDAWKAAAALWKASYDSPTEITDLNDILDLNMSAAPTSWQKIFDDTEAKKGWDSYRSKHSGALTNIDWSKQWPHWLRARKATKEATKDWVKDVLKAYAVAFNSHLRREIVLAANLALAKATRSASASTESEQQTLQSIKTKAAAAMCADTFSPDEAVKGCKPHASVISKQTTCTTGGSGKTGSSLALDMVCLCAAQTNAACRSADGGATELIASSTDIPGNSQAAVAELCTADSAFTVNQEAPNHIQGILNKLQSRIGLNIAADAGGIAYVGKTKGTPCSDSNGNCLQYGDFFASGKKGIASIPWADNLLAAGRVHQQLQIKKAEVANTRKQLAEIKLHINSALATPHPAPKR
uniref:Variant surface glycoprotein n=1 Tax=Trypanosoma brucei TaxID=5691 RepID=A0A1V0FY50_9TRYP|nr:variant surface glycoprotein [Trypanosoma brucei]